MSRCRSPERSDRNTISSGAHTGAPVSARRQQTQRQRVRRRQRLRHQDVQRQQVRRQPDGDELLDESDEHRQRRRHDPCREWHHLHPLLRPGRPPIQCDGRRLHLWLRPRKRQLKKRIYGRTKPGTLLKHHIPLKTDCWDVRQPGFTEVDLVSHAGSSASGDCCHSLNLTDIHTTWVETRAVLGKGQEGVRRAMETIRQALPFKLLGIDSDNGSEFINAHLYHYCQALEIQFTRGRPYKKDDNAHIEQKNWTHVRRLLGYQRYDSPTALEALNDLYGQELRLFQNLFLPSVKLRRKVRVGSKLKRVYDPPQTPFQRVCASKQVIPAKVAQLQQWRDRLDPFELSRQIEHKLERIFQLSSPTGSKDVSDPQFSQFSTTIHRKKKEPKKKE